MFKKINSSLKTFLDGQNYDIKIIRKNKVIYQNSNNSVCLDDVISTAKKSESYFVNYSVDMLNAEIQALLKINPISLDMCYSSIYEELDYYSFYLPNKDILYIKKKCTDDYHDYIKMKELYLDVCSLSRKRNTFKIGVPSTVILLNFQPFQFCMLCVGVLCTFYV